MTYDGGHSSDAQLDAELKSAEEAMVADAEVTSLKGSIAAREAQLLPLYVQISHEFADLHDRPGRMLAKGVISGIVPWKRSREYFYWRVRRRLLQDAMVAELRAADGSLTHEACLELIKGWMSGRPPALTDWKDDLAVVSFFESQGATIDEKVGIVKLGAIQQTVASRSRFT